ncbi:hypothetical protein T440DRAFT_394723, partial [Plenodomus tracheiphilus IPT5]
NPSGYQTIHTSSNPPILPSQNTSNPPFSYNLLAAGLDSNTIGTPFPFLPPSPTTPQSSLANLCPSCTSSAPTPRRWNFGAMARTETCQ